MLLTFGLPLLAFLLRHIFFYALSPSLQGIQNFLYLYRKAVSSVFSSVLSDICIEWRGVEAFDEATEGRTTQAVRNDAHAASCMP